MKFDFKYFPLIFVNAAAILAIVISHQMPQRPSTPAPELKAIQHAIENTPVPTLDLSPIKAEVSALATLIKQMQNEDEASLNTLLSNTKTELQSKLDAIHNTIISLEEKQHPVKILSETALPFKVISIDSLQHISVATASYDFKTTALEKGDTLAGWKVLDVDFATQSLEFENEDEAHVKVRLAGQTGAEHA
jgi:hypothetical protein